MLTNSPMVWTEGSDLSPVSSQVACEENPWGLELEVWRQPGTAAEEGESRPQTTLSASHKQDGILTGSPFLKGIEKRASAARGDFTSYKYCPLSLLPACQGAVSNWFSPAEKAS